MSMSSNNTEKFKQALDDRKINSTKLRKLVDDHAEKNFVGTGSERITYAAGIRKDLNGARMNEKTLKLGLEIIGLNAAEIEQVIAT